MTHLVHYRNLLTPFACALLVACSAPDTTAPNPANASDEPLAARSAPSSSYTVTDLGVPAGFVNSVAYDVNDAGIVVGTISGGTEWRGFARLSGALVALTSTNTTSDALAVSNGSPVYVVGSVVENESTQPARWTIMGTSVGQAEILPNPGYGKAGGVNDQGDAVGGRTIWWNDEAVAPETVAPPGSFAQVALTDINNANHVVFNATGSASSLDRGFFRGTTGDPIELAPPADMPTYYTVVDNMSDPDDGFVYVVGKVQVDEITCFPAMWTIDLANNTATVTVHSGNVGSAWGVSNAGTFAGHQGQRWSSKAYAWPLAGGTIALPVPKGGKNPHVRGMSPDGKLIVGSGEFSRGTRHALLWSGNGP